MSYTTHFFDNKCNSKSGHRALTGFLRKHWSRDIGDVVKHILKDCDVSVQIGALPPQLRDLLKPNEIATVTGQFRDVLDDFVNKKYRIFADKAVDQTYNIPEIGNLFDTQCELEVRGYADKSGVSYAGGRPWTGAFANVCKLSFPEFGLEYALKLYNQYVPNPETYGPLFGAYAEIAVAMAACRAEPRDNNPVYMARLGRRPYMLSLWVEENVSMPLLRTNKFEMFKTAQPEIKPRNWRAGRRIDYGATWQTPYGLASYSVRKLYRKIVNAADKNNVAAMQDLQDGVGCYVAQQELNQAIDCVSAMASYSRDLRLYNFVSSYRVR